MINNIYLPNLGKYYKMPNNDTLIQIKEVHCIISGKDGIGILTLSGYKESHTINNYNFTENISDKFYESPEKFNKGINAGLNCMSLLAFVRRQYKDLITYADGTAYFYKIDEHNNINKIPLEDYSYKIDITIPLTEQAIQNISVKVDTSDSLYDTYEEASLYLNYTSIASDGTETIHKSVASELALSKSQEKAINALKNAFTLCKKEGLYVSLDRCEDILYAIKQNTENGIIQVEYSSDEPTNSIIVNPLLIKVCDIYTHNEDNNFYLVKTNK